MGEENQLSSAVSDAIITESDEEPSPGQKTAGLLTLWDGDPVKKLAEQTSSFLPTESGSGYVYTETVTTTASAGTTIKITAESAQIQDAVAEIEVVQA